MMKLITNKGQNTAEYALLIALVIAGIIAMQTYAQRSLQARMKGAGLYLVTKTANPTVDGVQKEVLGEIAQYEPYYLNSQYNVVRNQEETEMITSKEGVLAGAATGKTIAGIVATSSQSDRTRTGSQASDYDGADGVRLEQ